MNNSTLDLIKEMIVAYKPLNIDSKRVWAYNGTQDLPEDNDLFIILSFRDVTPYSNIKRHKETENGLQEVITTNTAEDVLISLISRNTQARMAAFKISGAFKSDNADYIQEKNSFHISTINPVVDNSFLEATARLNRFDVTVRVIRAYEDVQDIDYYDKFPNTSEFEPYWLFDK